MTASLPALDTLFQEFPVIAYRCLNDDGWTMQYMSPGIELLAGYGPSVFLDPRGRSYAEIIHAEDREQVRRSIDQALQTDKGFVLDYRIVAADGTVRQVREYGTAIRSDDGAVVALQGFVAPGAANRKPAPHTAPSPQDLDRLYRALRIMKECNERLVRACDEGAFLSGLCQTMVETAGHAAASIAVAGPLAPQVLQYDASVREAPPAPVYSQLSWDAGDGQGQGPAARATQDGRPFVCADIANATLPGATRAQLLERGYRSAIWLPLNHGQQCLGVMSIYAGAPHVFDTGEAQLMQTLADNAALGIHAIRSQDQRKRIELAALKIAAGVSASTGDDFFSQFASNMALAAGADGAFVARFKDDGLQAVQTVAAIVDNAPVPNFEYGIAGSPCERLIASPDCIVLDEVASCFPASGAARMGMRGYAGCRLDSVGGRPLGLLFVLFREPVTQPELVTQTIQIFASRAGAELERQLSHARILKQASLLDKAKDAIVMHDAANRITFWNKGAERLYGLTAEAVLGRAVDEVVYDDAERYRDMRRSLARHDEWQGEMVRRRADGQEMTLEVNSTLARDAAGQPGSVLSIITDITRRKAAEREVAKLAFSDRLTGLPNRRLLETKLQAFLDAGASGGIDGALLWIDLDHLKSLNDTRGHDMGDQLLRQTAARIAATIGTGGIAARFGGDEFVVLMTACAGKPEAAAGVARELLHSLARPYDLDGYVHSGSASIGLAWFRCGQDAAGEILKRADIAMYEAKTAGRNTLRIFDRQMQESVDSQVALENDLRSALHGKGLHLAFQPQICNDGGVTGVEALLRWQHPTRGPVSPAEFIPVAESSGLIIACGEWVLEQACAQLKRWEGDPLTRALSVAVNVSAHQIRHPDFVEQVKRALQRTGADASKLKLELTESSLVADTEATVDKMKALKALGISFSLDDFGTGFSSLSYLRRLPLDQLKIDRSFVCDVVTDTNAAVITRSIIALGQSLALEVIAEGVESEQQRQFLAAHGCTVYQGYLFSKPLGVEALEAYLRHAAVGRSDR